MKVLPRRRRAVLLNLVLALGLAGGVGAAYAVTSTSSAAPKSNSSTSTATVQRGTVLATVSGSGSLVSPSDAGLNFTTGGTLTEVDVKAGDHVTKGQVLAKVDRTSAKATLAQAEANLTSAEAQLTSAEEGTTTTTSSGQGATPTTSTTVSATAVASAKAQVAQAKANVTSAQDALDGTVLKATVSGTVASVGGKVGDTVSGGSNSSGASGTSSTSSSSSSSLSGFVVITNPSGMEVTADFSETDALKLKKGQGATVTLNAESDTTLNAKVVSVSSLPVSSSGTGGGTSSSAVQYEAVLKITSATAGLRTGLSATVSVATGVATNALYLPTAAVSGTGTSRRVNVVNADGSTTTTTVTTGVEGTSGIQIVSGLTEGQKVQYTVASSSSSSNGFPGGGFPGGGAGAGGFTGAGAGGARGGRG